MLGVYVEMNPERFDPFEHSNKRQRALSCTPYIPGVTTSTTLTPVGSPEPSPDEPALSRSPELHLDAEIKIRKSDCPVNLFQAIWIRREKRGK